MPSLFRISFGLAIALLFQAALHATDENVTADVPSTESLASTIRRSLVTIRVRDRDGGELGLGTGFVVDPQGLIATNLHVISEGRPIEVELWPNQKLEVVAIEATSRGDDLALIRVAPAEHKLVPIPLGGEKIVAQGADVLAFGNPLGLRNSVVRGLVSAIRDIESRQMIQVAMPIEPGNSGGPLVDRQGTVQGIINMKSLQTDNVGFAVPVARLNELMQSTNPVAIDRWVRMAGVDPAVWQPLFGAQWRDRSGIIDVRGLGAGFGGRALCLHQSPVPGDSFEVAVQVKLDDEAGAAGLVFHADGKDRHYGFYPSNGRLRLTCFQGPSVYAWEVISDVASKHYLPGQWNSLKVRVQPNHFDCIVNGVLVIESQHQGLDAGQVGLAKFRDTQAEFRRFQLARDIQDDELSQTSQTWFEQLPDLSQLERLNDLSSIEVLALSSEASARELLRQAQAMNQQAERLKQLAEDVRIAPILQRLKHLLDSKEAEDLLEGALLIAALHHPDLDIPTYTRRVDLMAAEITAALPENASDEQKLSRLDDFLFEQNGYRGGRDEYYHAANNHLDRVIDDREGMPISLSLLYMELGRRLGMTLEGVGLPGHFVVRYRSSTDDTRLIDVYEKARPMADSEAAEIIRLNLLRSPGDDDLQALPPIEMLTRIIRNLIGSAERTSDLDSMRRYLEGLVALNDQSADFRLMRAVIRYQTNRMHAALDDFNWLLDLQPPGIDIDRIRSMREQVESEIQAED